MSLIVLALRGLLGTVFLMAAGSKLLGHGSFGEFRASVKAAVAGTRWSSTGVAAVLILLEIASVVTLAASPTIGFVVSAIAAGLLSAGVAWILGTSREVSCRCFGSEDAILSTRHLLRNGVLAIAALFGVLAAIFNDSDGPFDTFDGLFVVGGVFLGVLVTRWDDLAALILDDPPARGFSQEEMS